MNVYISQVQHNWLGWQRVEEWIGSAEWEQAIDPEPSPRDCFQEAEAAARFAFDFSSAPVLSYFSALPIGGNLWPFLFAFDYPTLEVAVFACKANLWHDIEWRQYVKLDFDSRNGTFNIVKSEGPPPSEWMGPPTG